MSHIVKRIDDQGIPSRVCQKCLTTVRDINKMVCPVCATPLPAESQANYAKHDAQTDRVCPKCMTTVRDINLAACPVCHTPMPLASYPKPSGNDTLHFVTLSQLMDETKALRICRHCTKYVTDFMLKVCPGCEALLDSASTIKIIVKCQRCLDEVDSEHPFCSNCGSKLLDEAVTEEELNDLIEKVKGILSTLETDIYVDEEGVTIYEEEAADKVVKLLKENKLDSALGEFIEHIDVDDPDNKFWNAPYNLELDK